jgi:hypothetical protein
MLRMAAAFRRALNNVAAGDPYFDNVVSLLHFDGNLTDQKGKTWTAFGNAAATGVAQYGTNSLTLDGNGDYLSTPDHDDFTFGSGDFTIEAWVNMGDNNFAVLLSKWGGSGQEYTVLMPGSGDNKVYFYYAGGAFKQFDWAPVLNTYYHFALCRSGNNLKLFIDGVQTGATADLAGVTIAGTAQSVIIGQHSGGSWFNGKIDEFRVTKGVGRYTADFTPPTLAFPNTRDLQAIPNIAETTLWADFTTDANSLVKGHVGTLGGGASVSGGSLNLTSPDGYCVWGQSPDFNVGAGDWTIEIAYTQTTATFSGGILCIKGPANEHGILIWDKGDGSSDLYMSTSGVSWVLNAQPSGTIPVGVRTSIVLQKSGSVLNIFNGPHLGTLTRYYNSAFGTVAQHGSGSYLSVGKDALPATYWAGPLNGKFDGIRITKGVARYVNNSSVQGLGICG